MNVCRDDNVTLLQRERERERERSLSLSVTMRERDREITTKRYVLHRERLQQKKRKIISMCS